MAPLAGGVAGAVDADFHHQLGFHQRDDQVFLAATPGGERPARPRMTVPPRSEQVGNRDTCRSGEGGAAGEPVTAPTIASLVSRILYFCQPLTEGW
ncbi:hypothetical protein AB0O86_37220 [Streptomyces hirsutus]|uniref:hypothetical protein n=1 Tax=Streptomyces hirsutus TaxID=35620 RepID=UPI0034274CCE